MAVFFVLLLFPVMIHQYSIEKNLENPEQKNRKILLLFFLFFTFLVMFRHESIGNDTTNYIRFFQRFSQMSWRELRDDDFEIGFSYFNKIISLLSKEPQFFLASTAVITNVMIYPTYKRLCVDPSLTITLFCTMPTFVMIFSGIRQMLAIGIGVIAYELMRQKKLLSFVFAVIVAINFHTSAFILIFMYPIYHFKINKKKLCAVIPGLLLVFLFNDQIFSFLTSIIEKYTKYESEISSTGAYTMLFLFVIFSVFAFIIPKESYMDEEIIGLRNFLLFSLVIQMFAPLHSLAMRMNYYYIIFIPLLLPKIIEYRSENWKEVALLGRHIMIIFFLVYFFVNAYNSGALNVFPYHFFWESV